MSGASVDHIILHCNDIAAAGRDFAAAGFTVQRRDDADPSHGTESRFVVFENGVYVLLMQFTDPAKRQAHRLGGFLDGGDGCVDYGIAVPDSMAAENMARELGLAPSAAGAHRNRLADGTPWGVRLFTIGRGAPAGHDALPFVVEDLEPRAARVPPFSPHRNGATTLRSLHVEADGAAQAARVLARILGVDTQARANGAATIALGDSAVVFHERDAAAPRAAGQGGVIRLDLGSGPGARADIRCCGALFSLQ